MTASNLPLRRRAFLRLAAVTAALPALPRFAAALDYPTRTVRIVCGFVAGLIPDIVARMIGQALSTRLGQQFIVDSRPGAATNIATELVANAAPDGYTLLVITSSNTSNATLYTNLKFDLVRDFVPVATTFRSALILLVTPDLPVKTVAEYIAYAKVNPRKINYASPGIGTLPHIAGELFSAMTGVDIVHVPYRNAYLPDLLAGQVQATFSSIATALEFTKKDILRALGGTTTERSDALPDVPAIAEVLPGYEAYIWDGIAAPKGTPPEIIERLNREINAVLAEPAVKSRLLALAAEPMVMSPADMTKFIAAEIDKWGKVIRDARIKIE